MECDAERLAILVSQRPAIYDFNLMEHNNRELVDSLWEQIAANMDSTVAHCKAKWCNIRNCYSRFLRTRRNDPSPLTGRRKKKWYLADTLKFLDPFMSQTRKSMEEKSFELPLEVIQEFKEEAVSSDGQCIQSMIIKSEDESCEPKRKSSKTKMTTQELAYHYRPNLTIPDDLDFDFFKCMFLEFKKLQPRRQRKFKEVILTTLNRYLDEEEDNLPVESNTSGCNTTRTSQDQRFESPTNSEVTE